MSIFKKLWYGFNSLPSAFRGFYVFGVFWFCFPFAAYAVALWPDTTSAVYIMLLLSIYTYGAIGLAVVWGTAAAKRRWGLAVTTLRRPRWRYRQISTNIPPGPLNAGRSTGVALLVRIIFVPSKKKSVRTPGASLSQPGNVSPPKLIGV